jgi:hypothetical protein
MAPGAIQPETATNSSNGTILKPTARAFHPTGTPDPAKYHSSSTSDAISAEAEFAAHNYHPLPIGMHPIQRIFQKANMYQSSHAQAVQVFGIPKANITWISSQHIPPSTKATATPSL